MQAVILAGGKGTRIRPITYRIPKPIIHIHSRPFMHFQLEYIISFGVDKVLILVRYLGNYIEEYFNNGSRFGIKIDYSYEETPLGTGGTLKKAEDQMQKSFCF